jgi:hypothetical protein
VGITTRSGYSTAPYRMPSSLLATTRTGTRVGSTRTATRVGITTRTGQPTTDEELINIPLEGEPPPGGLRPQISIPQPQIPTRVATGGRRTFRKNKRIKKRGASRG